MDGKYTFNTLQFQNYRILDNQIEAITTIKGNPLVKYRDCDLSLKLKPSQVQFMT